jgi:hypothetical protein
MDVNYKDLQRQQKYIIQIKNKKKIGIFINFYDKYSCAYFKILYNNDDYYYEFINYKSSFYNYKSCKCLKTKGKESEKNYILDIINNIDIMALSLIKN